MTATSSPTSPTRLPTVRFTAAMLAVFSASILFAQIWKADLYADSLAYASVSKNLARTGEWLTPMWGPIPHFHKPPLIFWLTALNFRLVGVHPAAAVFWTAALGLVAVVLTYLLARRWFGEWTAVWSAFILATTPPFAKQCFSFRLDAPLVCFVMAAMVAAFAGVSGRPRLHLVAGLMIGLAILTKGPVGVLGFAPYGFLLLVRPPPPEGAEPRARWWLQPSAWAGLSLAAAMVASWVVAMILKHGRAFIEIGLWTEGIARPFIRMAEPPAWPYGSAMLTYYWPWLPLLLLGIGMYIARMRRQGWRWEGMYVAFYCVGLLVVLNVAAEKYPRYLMPLYPFLAMLAAIPMSRWVSEKRLPGFVRGLGVAGVLIALLANLLPVSLSADRNAEMRVMALSLRGTPQEIAVSPLACGPNNLSAIWYYADVVPKELEIACFPSAGPPTGECFHLFHRPEETEELQAVYTLSGSRPFRGKGGALMLSEACYRSNAPPDEG